MLSLKALLKLLSTQSPLEHAVGPRPLEDIPMSGLDKLLKCAGLVKVASGVTPSPLLLRHA